MDLRVFTSPGAKRDAASGSCKPLPARRATRGRPGFSLFELVLVLAIMSVLMALSVPSFRRATEQSHADIAAANLRATWSAQRFYWLDNRQYASNFSDLQSLLDPGIVAAVTPYTYTIQVVDANTFTVTATRTGNTKWTGQLRIDQTGSLSGSIQAAGQTAIVPGFQ